MSGEGYRILLDCRRRSRVLRARMFTFDQIADVLALDHAVSPLRLYRYAHGRTAGDVVTAYNDLDPAGTASLREARLYDYEAWPRGGRRVPAGAVAIFARIYQTAARRLLADEAYAAYNARDRDLLDRVDYRHLDSHRAGHVPPEPARGSMRAETVPARGPGRPAHYAELLRVLSAEEADVRRRELLFELALLLGGAPAVGLLRHLTPPERHRLVAVARQQAPVDGGAIDLLERLTARLWGMDDPLGPGQVLAAAEAKRELLADLLRHGSLTPSLRDRLLRLYWGLCHLAGWSHYDLMDYEGAVQRYTDGLRAAHELGDPTLLAHMHGGLAAIANHRGRRSVALDHAFAAEGWAKSSRSALQQAATSVSVARVVSSARRDDCSLHMLDRAVELAGRRPSEIVPPHLFWCSPERIYRNALFCLLELGQPDQAIRVGGRILSGMHPEWVRERGLVQLECATAFIQKKEIPVAAEMIGEAARATAAHSSARLVHSVRRARARLQPWADNRYVRELDERLRALAVPPSPGELGSAL